MRPFRLLALGLSLAYVGRAIAQDIDQPAGDLPQTDEPQTQSPEGEARPAGLDDEKDAENKANDLNNGIEDNKTAWESYDDKGSGKGEEITKGVRVEDIIEPPSDYRYAAFGKGDPFVPPSIIEEEKVINPLEIPIVSPLQRFRLEELSLVGIWQLASGERKALIMTPNQGDIPVQGIIVKNSDPIGQKGGRIMSIGDDYLTVREFTLGPDGARQYEDQQIFMGPRNFDDVDGKILFKPGGKQPEVIIKDAGLNPAAPNDGGLAPPPGRAAQVNAARQVIQRIQEAVDAPNRDLPAKNNLVQPPAAAPAAAPAPNPENAEQPLPPRVF